MIYYLNDIVVLAGIECKVVFFDVNGFALLAPTQDQSGTYNNSPILKGLVISRVNKYGIDSLKNKAILFDRETSGAV